MLEHLSRNGNYKAVIAPRRAVSLQRAAAYLDFPQVVVGDGGAEVSRAPAIVVRSESCDDHLKPRTPQNGIAILKPGADTSTMPSGSFGWSRKRGPAVRELVRERAWNVRPRCGIERHACTSLEFSSLEEHE